MKDDPANLLMVVAREFANKGKPDILYTKLELSGLFTPDECDFVKSERAGTAKVLVSILMVFFY